MFLKLNHSRVKHNKNIKMDYERYQVSMLTKFVAIEWLDKHFDV